MLMLQSSARKIRFLALVNLLICFLSVYFFQFSKLDFLLGAFFCITINLIGNNIGLHRYFSHNSFKLKNDFFLLFLSTLSCLGSQISYSMVHRLHHLYSDTDKDPQNLNIGLFRSLIMNYNLVQAPHSLIKDLYKKESLVFVHRYYLGILAGWCLVLFLINPKAVFLCFSLPGVYCWLSAITIGTITHLRGYRNFETNDNSYNNILASIISFGEGWHNNHHHNPRLFRHQYNWWEFDPASYIIGAIRNVE